MAAAVVMYPAIPTPPIGIEGIEGIEGMTIEGMTIEGIEGIAVFKCPVKRSLTTHPLHRAVVVRKEYKLTKGISFSSFVFFVISPIRKMNIAEAIAAAIHHKSPMLGGPPSKDNSAVPVKAVKADIHVLRL